MFKVRGGMYLPTNEPANTPMAADKVSAALAAKNTVHLLGPCSWDAKSMVMLGLCLSTIDHLPRLMSQAEGGEQSSQVAGEERDQRWTSSRQMQELGR